MDFLSSVVRSEEADVGTSVESLCGNEDVQCIIGAPRDCVGEECGSMVPGLVFPFLAISVGLILHPLSHRFRVPYTSMLMFVGVILGCLGCSVQMGLLTESLQLWAHISPPTLFFYIFLAPLVFEAAFNTDAHLFGKFIGKIIFLAFGVVVAQIFLIAVFQLYVIQSPDWTLYSALVFGAMLSATDPISVTATLKELGVSENLNTLIEGESLLNDGSAVVFYEAFLEGAIEGGLSGGEVIVQLLRLSLGGMAMGLAFALVAIVFLAMVYEMFEVEVSMTLVVAFLGFWTAQSPSILSGVICNVTAGIMLSAYGKGLVSPTVRDPLQKIWHLLSWIANTIVFVYAGLLVVAYIWSCAGDPLEWYDYVHILTWYAFINVLRFGLIFLSHPIMSYGSKWYKWKQAAVLSYSGLRGAVTLILALEVGDTSELPSSVRSRVVVWSSALVAMTLFVNGMTIKSVLHLLKLDRADPVKEEFLWRARATMLEKTFEILDVVAIDGNSKTCSWSTVASAVAPKSWITDIGRVQRALESSMDVGRASTLSSYRPSPENHMGGARRSISRSVTGRSSIALSRPSAEAARLSRTSFVASNSDASSVGRISGAYVRGPSDMEVLAARRGSAVGLVGFTAESKARLVHELEEEVGHLQINQEIGEAIDVEVRRRVLTSLLSVLRETYATSVSNYVFVSALTEDIKDALDANDEGEVYELFQFLLDNPTKLPIPDWMDKSLKWFHDRFDKLMVRLFSKSRYQSRIVLATMISSALRHVLCETYLQQSDIVLEEMKSLYEITSSYLAQLEAAIPDEFARVQTKSVIELVFQRQAACLEAFRREGSIDMEEFEEIHEELLELQRKYFLHTSKIVRNVQEKEEKDKYLLKRLPIFNALDTEIFNTSVLEKGRFAHLGKGEQVPVSGDAVVFVLRGAVRIEKSATCAIGDMGHSVSLPSVIDVKTNVDSLPLHMCFQKYSVVLPVDFFAESSHKLPALSTCHIIGGASVFILPGQQARELSLAYEWFRSELAKHIVRLIMFGYLALKSNWIHNFADSSNSGETPVEVATHILQTLPYCSLVGLTRKHGAARVQGPGVLLQGKLTVSRKDLQSYLLDSEDTEIVEELEAPAILPPGLLSVELVESEDSDELETAEMMVQDLASPQVIAEDRILRWTGPPYVVDENGRFGFHKHFEQACGEISRKHTALSNSGKINLEGLSRATSEDSEDSEDSGPKKNDHGVAF
ncbi:hypothetical protein NDN08_005297 [Rhodosorus marinus]|uniref:Cation/H+ exchanger transmembrane domain-containing protein n=1 Tax=Rhodosorus marinus TaxID=101924 RepID=A0AAV8V4L7_9RHOD|nr:hypothetical protein NDN08_005297 [Rhodosorus marinus]